MEESNQRSIGQYLKSFREEKQIMLRDISETTCISERILKNIESDKFDEMGGLGYAKAITISYAKALGANDKLVLHIFNSKYSKPVAKSLYHRENQPRKFMIPTSLFSILLLVILVVIITFFIVKLYSEGNLSFPFRKGLKAGKVEKLEVDKEPVRNAVSIYDSLKKEKQAAKDKKNDLSSVKAVQIDVSALNDSTDYTDKYLFEGKESPFNVKDN